MTKLASTVGWGIVLAALAAPPLPAQVEPQPVAAVPLNGANRETAPPERDGLAAVLATEQQTADAQRMTDNARHDAVPAANPLDRFMATWLSPADFRLLLPKNVAAWPVGTGASGSLVGARAASGSMAVAAKANPYLAELPVATAPIVAPDPKRTDHTGKDASMPTTAAAMPVAVSTGASPAPASPSPARPGETWKARDDAKYFKQLKRF